MEDEVRRSDGKEINDAKKQETMEKMAIADDERLPLIGDLGTGSESDANEGNKRTRKQVSNKTSLS